MKAASLIALPVIGALLGCSARQTLEIAEQGSFAVGGTVVQAPGVFDRAKPLDPAGQTLHGDHASVSYQLPPKAQPYPLVFLHGAGQSSRCWDTTPDGREGWRTRFLREGFGVYLVDQPRRGQAGRSTVNGAISATPDDQLWLTNFRSDAGAFPEGPEAMDQFLRWMTPNTGDFDAKLIAESLVALSEKIGPNILITHSQGGIPGWLVPGLGGNVAGIVGIEPGCFVFPEGEAPAPIPNTSPFTPITPQIVSQAAFARLCEVPLLVVFGDGIASAPTDDWPADGWRARVEMARLFVDCVNRHGGKATLLLLPEHGLTGNTHFPFADTNSDGVADLLLAWFSRMHLMKQ